MDGIFYIIGMAVSFFVYFFVLTYVTTEKHKEMECWNFDKCSGLVILAFLMACFWPLSTIILVVLLLL